MPLCHFCNEPKSRVHTCESGPMKGMKTFSPHIDTETRIAKELPAIARDMWIEKGGKVTTPNNHYPFYEIFSIGDKEFNLFIDAFKNYIAEETIKAWMKS